MSNPNMEAKVKELMELKRMKEEIEAEIAAAEDEIKAVMGNEETLLAGAFKVDWKTVITSRTRFLLSSVLLVRFKVPLFSLLEKLTEAVLFAVMVIF